MKCHEVLTIVEQKKNDINNLLIEIIRDNRDLRNEIIRQQKEANSENENKINNINYVTIEKQINNINHVSINVFLNEKCKNAINLSQFINSIEINNETIEQCPNNGLIKSISDAFINALRQLDYYERPIHCSDRKRSTLYIKDNDKWDKDIEHEHMKEAIDTIYYKHFMTLKEWLSKNPNFDKDDKLQAEYIEMANHITMDLREKNSRPYRKIIQNVSQETYVSGLNNVITS
jgi:hypothetical protein